MPTTWKLLSQTFKSNTQWENTLYAIPHSTLYKLFDTLHLPDRMSKILEDIGYK